MTDKISFTSGSLGSIPFLERILQDALSRVDVHALLHYGDAKGEQLLREHIIKLHFPHLTAESVRVTSSGQQAINLVFDFLLEDPNRKHAILQAPSFFGAIRSAKEWKSKGIHCYQFENVSQIEEIVKNNPKGSCVVYLTSNFAQPSGYSLSITDKQSLAQLAKDYDCVIIEDNPYDLIHFGNFKPSTIFELAPDHVIYLGGFSKILGPGLRIGYIIGTKLISHRRLHSLKITNDLFTSTLSQQTCIEVFNNHRDLLLQDLRSFMRSKRDLALKTLETLFQKAKKDGIIDWSVPEGGVFLNIVFKKIGKDQMDLLFKEAKENFHLELEGNQFHYLEQLPVFDTRINFVLNEDKKLIEGLERLAAVCKKIGVTTEDVVIEKKIISKNQMKVLVLCGATDLPTGLKTTNTPQKLVHALIDQGHEVHTISQRGNVVSERARGHHFATIEEYETLAQELLQNKTADVVVIPINLYIVENDSVKQLPSLLQKSKKWSPTTFLVGFSPFKKFKSFTELVDDAYAYGIKNHCNLTVASGFVEDKKRKFKLVITPEKGLFPTNNVSEQLVPQIEHRMSRRHYKTVVHDDKEYLQTYSGPIDKMVEHIKTGFKYGLFHSYFENNEEHHFGFVAMRAPENKGFFITARGSNKRLIPQTDVVYVSSVDFSARVLNTHSTEGKKASLNANLAAKIFDTRKDVNLIVHAHIFPGCDNRTEVDYSPGTQEDVDEVMFYFSKDQKIVELLDHGIIVVGQDMNEVMEVIGVEHSYFKFPEKYDVIYKRFQFAPDFVQLVSHKVENREANILDLACGTGDVSASLLSNGFKSITLADQSAQMLQVASAKIQSLNPSGNFNTIQTLMQDLANIPNQNYDACVIRQAINYAMTVEGLTKTLGAIRSKLKTGGVLIFNTPNYIHEQREQYNNSRTFNYEIDGIHQVEVKEFNHIDPENILSHSQSSTIVTYGVDVKISKLFDLNKFGMFSVEDFKKSFAASGWDLNNVEFLGKDMKTVTNDSKALYVVARRS
jgi:2-aminoadipate transaminase